jgi:hypothetical protein
MIAAITALCNTAQCVHTRMFYVLEVQKLVVYSELRRSMRNQ